jgi:ubiquinone/menaquinone biosynthesis C-methylase UbiE/chorismate mutase
MLLAVVARRMQLARRVAWTKSRRRDAEYPEGEPISRPEIEALRLNDIAERATSYGVDPNLARTLLYILISDSCKEQMIRWQSDDYDYGEYSYEELKENLRTLTRLVAAGHDPYDGVYPATQLYTEYEESVIKSEVDKIEDRAIALDLGCGTGGLSRRLARKFKEVIAVDISPEMVEVAAVQGTDRIKYVVADIETQAFWDEIPDESVDFVVMSHGMSSVVQDLPLVIRNVRRVLRSRGSFVLTFYNRDSLLYSGMLLPWSDSLAAVIDPERSCLDVHVDDRVISVYARAYSMDEVTNVVERSLSITGFSSYPTLASILPREVLEDEVFRTFIAKIDRQIADDPRLDGAYLVTTGRK